MERYQVNLYKKTREGWQLNPPLIETTTVEASDSYAAAKEVVEQYLNKTTKVFGKPRPLDVPSGMLFETMHPGIVIHVEDLNILQPFRVRPEV